MRDGKSFTLYKQQCDISTAGGGKFMNGLSLAALLHERPWLGARARVSLPAREPQSGGGAAIALVSGSARQERARFSSRPRGSQRHGSELGCKFGRPARTCVRANYGCRVLSGRPEPAGCDLYLLGMLMESRQSSNEAPKQGRLGALERTGAQSARTSHSAS